ncbi:hypothetical protein EMIT0P218_130094 [Pseudomonas sp. IT-P218]
MTITKAGDTLLIPLIASIIQKQQVRGLSIPHIPEIKLAIGFVGTRQKDHEPFGISTFNNLKMLTFHCRKFVHDNKPIIRKKWHGKNRLDPA